MNKKLLQTCVNIFVLHTFRLLHRVPVVGTSCQGTSSPGTSWRGAIVKCNSAHSNSIGRNLSPAPEKNPESVADIIYFGPRKKSRLLFFRLFSVPLLFFSTVVLHFRWRIICPDAQSSSSLAPPLPPPRFQMISKLIFHKKPEITSIKSSDWWRSQFSTR